MTPPYTKGGDMLETHLRSSVTQRRLRSGPAADHVDGFADWLHDRGYRPRSVEDVLRALAGWTDWMGANGFTAHDVLAAFSACKAALQAQPHVRYRRGINAESLMAASVYVRFLQGHGVVSRPVTSLPPSDRWPILGAFRLWMRQHRGLTESTLDAYEGILVGLCEKLGNDPGRYTAEALRTFVLERARPHGIWRAKSIVVAVRALLRFLGATGQCPPDREHAIPGFASWQLSSVPRFLVPEDVERVIGSCGGYTNELRDRAVLLLLARLGLRASEVAGLRFTDIDWDTGRIAVGGKGRRQEWLPLPQEVGTALRRYLRKRRPPLSVPEVFTTVLAPVRPLTRAAVTHIVRSALGRTGIKAPINGAHVLRHSAATAMLRQGASLASIGAVLRHRSPQTTAHYAKVDFGLLSEIAQPWPQVSSC
jgi:integrase/recombinase XerD